MPKANKRKIPEDFDKVKPTIEKLQLKLKEAQRKSIKTETKQTSLWPILKLDHQISRYVYSMYYEKKLISRELYDYLLRQKYVNADLIAKWKKQGYEKLCLHVYAEYHGINSKMTKSTSKAVSLVVVKDAPVRTRTIDTQR
ncbi:hypothetical protein CA7LBN_000485 [Candidozyma auris]|uniref:Cell cycle control protein cwf14 n=1 Tax=Candidozyma auris TaxID=498019 RepID=A0A8F2VXL8_CANAR|nr:hypothetical protein CA7LBN_000485 [[Candida] auris]